MTDNRAYVQAQIVDIQMDRLHKQYIKITLHVPEENGDAVSQAFGIPSYTRPIPVVVARLDPSGVVVAPSTSAPAPEPLSPTAPARATNRYVTRAAILCGEPMFHIWLKREKKIFGVVDENSAAVAMRHLLGITSRKEIIPGTDVEVRYNKLVAEYEAWAHPNIIDETPEVARIP